MSRRILFLFYLFAAFDIFAVNFDDGKDVICCDNGVVKLKIMPGKAGRITDFRLKSNNLMTIYPSQENICEVIPGTGIALGVSAQFGTIDAIWSGGLDLFKIPYSLEILESTPSISKVRLTGDTGQWKIRKELSLVNNSSAVDIKVEITNKSNIAINKSYWFQAFLRLADTLSSMAGDDSELLLMPSRIQETTLHETVKPSVSGDILFLRNPETRQSFFIAPGAPWIASIDKTQKLIFGLCVEDQNFPSDMFYYSWEGRHKEFYSMEVIFPSYRFLPGQAHSYNFRMMVLQGLADLHFLGRDYAIEIVGLPKAFILNKMNNKLTLKIAALSPFINHNCDLEIIFVDDKGNVVQSAITMSSLRPDTVNVFTSDIRLDSLVPGKIRIKIKDKNGLARDLSGMTFELKKGTSYEH